MNEVLLARIAVALEGINDKLEKLSDCVDEPLPLVGGSQFCVKGNID